MKRRDYKPDAKIFEECKEKWFSQMALILKEEVFLHESREVMIWI